MNGYRDYIEQFGDDIEALIEAQIQEEMVYQQKSKKEVEERLKETYDVMKEAAMKAIAHPERYRGKIICGNAKKLFFYADTKGTYCGKRLNLAMARALSATEVNASMGKICAAPTAGSCGILPGILVTVCENEEEEYEKAMKALVVTAVIGDMIDRKASLSGAEGGCQAECGSAAAMGAAALVYLKGGSMTQMFHGAAIAIKIIMGLVCDPVAGLVEVPCAKRNAAGVMQAFMAADMALAGIPSYIPFDDVIEAMGQVGRSLPPSLKETSLGGVAITEEGKRLQRHIYRGKMEETPDMES